jgi:hypothetical protein
MDEFQRRLGDMRAWFGTSTSSPDSGEHAPDVKKRQREQESSAEVKTVTFFSEVIDLANLLQESTIKKGLTLQAIANGSILAFKNIGDKKDKHWNQLDIKTVRDLAENKCVRCVL